MVFCTAVIRVDVRGFVEIYCHLLAFFFWFYVAITLNTNI